MSLLSDEEIEEIQNREFSQNDWLWFYTRAIEAAILDKLKAQEPARDGVALIVTAALYDFGGWLTTRDERITLSATDNASPMADAIVEFCGMRNINLNQEVPVLSWQEWATEHPIPADDVVRQRDELLAALESLVRESREVADDYHRPRYTRLDGAILSAINAIANVKGEPK